MADQKDKQDFLRAAKQSQPGVLRESCQWLRHNKKWWLAPIVIMLVLLSALIFFTQGSAVAPFIYTIF